MPKSRRKAHLEKARFLKEDKGRLVRAAAAAAMQDERDILAVEKAQDAVDVDYVCESEEEEEELEEWLDWEEILEKEEEEEREDERRRREYFEAAYDRLIADKQSRRDAVWLKCQEKYGPLMAKLMASSVV